MNDFQSQMMGLIRDLGIATGRIAELEAENEALRVRVVELAGNIQRAGSDKVEGGSMTEQIETKCFLRERGISTEPSDPEVRAKLAEARLKLAKAYIEELKATISQQNHDRGGNGMSTEYRLVVAKGFGELEEHVNDYLGDGWYLHGSPGSVADGEGTDLYQAVARDVTDRPGSTCNVPTKSTLMPLPPDAMTLEEARRYVEAYGAFIEQENLAIRARFAEAKLRLSEAYVAELEEQVRSVPQTEEPPSAHIRAIAAEGIAASLRENNNYLRNSNRALIAEVRQLRAKVAELEGTE